MIFTNKFVNDANFSTTLVFYLFLFTLYNLNNITLKNPLHGMNNSDCYGLKHCRSYLKC